MMVQVLTHLRINSVSRALSRCSLVGDIVSYPLSPSSGDFGMNEATKHRGEAWTMVEWMNDGMLHGRISRLERAMAERVRYTPKERQPRREGDDEKEKVKRYEDKDMRFAGDV